MKWFTNDQDAARNLREIDKRYERARFAARHLNLHDKIEALCAAKKARDAAYLEVAP